MKIDIEGSRLFITATVFDINSHCVEPICSFYNEHQLLSADRGLEKLGMNIESLDIPVFYKHRLNRHVRKTIKDHSFLNYSILQNIKKEWEASGQRKHIKFLMTIRFAFYRELHLDIQILYSIKFY